MTDRTAPSSDARKRRHERDMADAHATARARDAYRTRTHAINPTTGEFTPLTQETEMTKHDRHDELVALLTEIRDRLPERVVVTQGFLDRLDAEEDEIVAQGIGFLADKPTPADDLPGEPGDRCPHDIYDRGDGTVSECSLPKGHAPTAHDSGDGVMWTDGKHWKDEDSNLDDLPGEPVEPGDLRAGDRVAFMWGDERITGTLVSVHGVLRSGVPDSKGYRPSVVWHGEWAGGISDVRLLERAPREDKDQEEAQYEADQTLADVLKAHHEDRRNWVYTARAARESIEAEVLRKVERATDDRYDRALYRAEQAEAERDALRERVDALIRERGEAHDEARSARERLNALRDDIVNGRLLSAAEAAFGGWLINRDDERAKKGEQR